MAYAPAPEWHSIGKLILDVDGHLWQAYQKGWIWHGPVERLEVPGPLLEDAAALLDLWRDAFDARAEAEQSWWRSRR